MKKIYKIIILLFIIIIVAFFTLKYEDKILNVENNLKYNYINKKNKGDNMEKYLKGNIEEFEKYDLKAHYNVDANNFYEISYSNLKELFEKNQTFILYVGVIGCPWCEELMPEIVNVNNNNNENNYNILIWDIGNEQAKSNKKYEDKLEELKKYIGEYYNIKNEEQKIVVPKLFFVKNGMIQYVHEYTIPDHNAKERKMTEEEKQKLRDSLSEGFKRIKEDKNYNFKRNPRYK